MPPVFVQANAFCSPGTLPTSVSVSTLADTTAGNYILVFAFGFAIAGHLTDSQGNTYSFNVQSNGGVTEYHANPIAGGPLTITLTFTTPPSGGAGIAVLEYANAADNITDQLENVTPFGNVSDYGLCPGCGSDGYLVTTGAGTNLTAVYAWQLWQANLAYGGTCSGDPLYVLNNLTPATLEGAPTAGTSGATQPAWNPGGNTADNTVTWTDSLVTSPGQSLAVVGILCDSAAGNFTLNGTGWTRRAIALGQDLIAVYERGPEPFLSTYTVSIDKSGDTFDLAAQLAQITGLPFVPPPGISPYIDPKNLPAVSLPFCVDSKDSQCRQLL